MVVLAQLRSSIHPIALWAFAGRFLTRADSVSLREPFG